MRFFFLARKMISKSTDVMSDVFCSFPVRTVHCFNLLLHVIRCRFWWVFCFSVFIYCLLGWATWLSARKRVPGKPSYLPAADLMEDLHAFRPIYTSCLVCMFVILSLDTISCLHCHLRAALSPPICFVCGVLSSYFICFYFPPITCQLVIGRDGFSVAILYKERCLLSSWLCLARQMYYFKGRPLSRSDPFVLYQSHNRPFQSCKNPRRKNKQIISYVSSSMAMKP
jgi:hypothetical protein